MHNLFFLNSLYYMAAARIITALRPCTAGRS